MMTSPKAVNSGQTEREAFKEFRAALYRMNDANTPVSVADRVMILSNATFLLDEYERAASTATAMLDVLHDSNRENDRAWSAENRVARAAAPQGLTDERILELARKWGMFASGIQQIQGFARDVFAEQSAAPMATPHRLNGETVARLKHLLRRLDLENAVPPGILSDPEALFSIFGQMRSQLDRLTVLPRASEQADEAVTTNGKPASQYFRAGRGQGLQEAMLACKREHLEEPAATADDIAYTTAVDDCIKAIGRLTSTAPAATDSGVGRDALVYPDEFTDDLKWILGLMCFQCIPYAQTFRAAGVDVPKKAEAEQAYTLDWLLRRYLKDPENWRKTAVSEMHALSQKAGEQDASES